MNINRQEIAAAGIKVTILDNNLLIARAYLYLLCNDLHKDSFGFLEDVFVEEQFRGKGYGEKITAAVIEEARKRGCYKLICTSRFSNEKAHKLYEKLGFKEHGNEFRIDF